MSKTLHAVMDGRFTRLRDTYRYSAQPVLVRENVAEHSFWTGMIGVTIAVELDMKHLAKSIALRALFHDIEECMTGDLVREMKYANSHIREEIRVIEREFVDKLTMDLGEFGRFAKGMWGASKDNTVAGQIVSLADALSVIAYCRREMKLGNTYLWEISESCEQLINRKFTGTFLENISKEAMYA